MGPRARAKQHRARVGGVAARDVEPSIADHHRSPGIQIELRTGLFDQPRAGLPASTRLAILLDLRLGKMRTEIETIDAAAGPRQMAINDPMHLVDERLIDHPARN